MTSNEINEKLQDECGVLACVASGTWPSELDLANMMSLGLFGLQHRGQESAGIVTSTGNVEDRLRIHKGMGLVNSIFTSNILSQLDGNLGIGHTRYSTHGSSELSNCQPFVVDTKFGRIAVAHNGELVNKMSIRKEMLNRGVGLSTGSDSELITQLLCVPLASGEEESGDWTGRLQNFMKYTSSAYSLVMLHGDTVYAARDPYGTRPLSVGRLFTHTVVEHSSGHHDVSCVTAAWVVTSESCVFESMGGECIREVYPGEIVKVTKDGIVSVTTVPRPECGSAYPAFCIFEYVYFARPDSIFEGQTVYNVRQRCGIQLAKEAPIDVDIISTVPESATPAAYGYSKETGIPYNDVLAKNRYIGRTFIQPTTKLRKLAVSKKFGVLTENVKGKRIAVVDDSIVRGNTMASIIKMLREGGAAEVHIRIASPPVRDPCYMGINIPTRKELLANKMTIDQTASFLGADSVAYLSVEGLLKAVRQGIPTCNDDVEIKKGCECVTKNGPLDSVVKCSTGCKKASSANGKIKHRITHPGEYTSKIGHCVACLTGIYPVELDW